MKYVQQPLSNLMCFTFPKSIRQLAVFIQQIKLMDLSWRTYKKRQVQRQDLRKAAKNIRKKKL